MATLLLVPQSTVTTGMGSRLVQVDVHFGMSEMFVAASAGDYSLFALDNRLLSDEVDGPAWIDDLGGVLEASISVVIFVVFLQCDVNKMLFNHTLQQQKSIELTWPVCVSSAPFSAARRAAAWVPISRALLQ